MGLPIGRVFLYFGLFMLSSVLLGLTAYRVSVTESRGLFGFYEPIIMDLLVTSCLGVLVSLYCLFAILFRLRGAVHSYAAEQIALWILWIMFLVGASIQTARYGGLWRCRRVSYQCRILESIKSFAWITWIWITFVIISSYASMSHGRRKFGTPLHGRDMEDGYPRSRSAPHTTSTGSQTHQTTETTQTPYTVT